MTISHPNKISVIFILGYTDDVRDFLLRAEAEDMLNGYVWVGVDILKYGTLILFCPFDVLFCVFFTELLLLVLT